MGGMIARGKHWLRKPPSLDDAMPSNVNQNSNESQQSTRGGLHPTKGYTGSSRDRRKKRKQHRSK